MRVNVEDDLFTSGRLGAFARHLGLSEDEALGPLVIIWRETQHRELMLVTEDQFVSAIKLRLGHRDGKKLFAAMVAAELINSVDGETWLIRGNDTHVARLRAWRGSASAGGKARASQAAAKRQTSGASLADTGLPNLSPNPANGVPKASPTSALLTPYSLLQDQDPDLTAPPKSADSRSSLLSSDAKNEIALTAPPSAAAVALSVLDLPKPKRKERSADQKRRSVANARLYCELYERAEGHPPSGLDQSFYGMMARFSDKHADSAEQILRWVFQCPDKSFRTKGWPLAYIIDQAPRLWRELNNPRAAVENLAAPRQQQQLALAASNDLAFDEYQRRKAERLANANQV